MTANDELYRVPLGEFIATRDALAARLKGEGDTAGAAAVKGARKPSVPAWAANQVVWHAAAEWERLRAATAALRESHGKAMAPEGLRQAARAQREALQACEARAAEWLVRHGHAAGPAVLQKVSHTLLALAYGGAGPTPGRLDHELPAPGFEALSGLALAAPVAPAPAVPPPPAGDADAPKRAEKDRAARRAAIAAAEARRTAAQRAVDKAQARLRTAEARRDALAEQLAAARRASDDARRVLDEAMAEQAAADAAWEARPALD